MCKECDLIYQAPNNGCNCHSETPHRILQDNLLDGGNEESVEQMSKLAGQVQGKYIIQLFVFCFGSSCCMCCWLYSGSGVAMLLALSIDTDVAKCKCELVLWNVWLAERGVEVLCG